MITDKDAIDAALYFAKGYTSPEIINDAQYNTLFSRLTNKPIEFEGFTYAGTVAMCNRVKGKKTAIMANGKLVIPKAVKLAGEWYLVTEIHDGVFRGLASWKFELKLPETIIAIGDNAFRGSYVQGCVDLSKIKYVGEGAFCNCVYLEEIMLPEPNVHNDFKVSDSLCNVAKGLETIRIPEGYRAIGRGAFGYTTDVTSISIPDSVEHIGQEAFAHSGQRTGSKIKLELPQNLLVIDKYAFCCTNIAELVFRRNPQRIQTRAFSGCYYLREVRWGHGSVDYIGEGAFAFCDLQDKLRLPTVIKRIHTRAFDGNPRMCSLLVYNGTKISTPKKISEATWATAGRQPEIVTY